MRRLLSVIVVSAVFAASACGGHSGSPTSPSNSSSSSSSMATVTGTVQGASGNALLAASTGAALTGVTVTVVGTSISSGVDAAGRFMLANVPPGNVQLRISGSGTDATVPLNPVQAAQTVDVVLVVSGSSATVDSEVRSGAGEAELEGRIESLPPTMPALIFKAAGKTVKTSSSTQFFQGGVTRAFSDLQIGMRVHVKGTLSGDTLTASLVEIQNTNTSIPVEINGVIDSVTGTASAFQFKIGSRVIHGDGATAFFGDGDKPDSFSSLKDGVRVEVKGDQRDGFVFATRIHVNGPDDNGDDNGQDTSASIHGTLKAIGGSKPNLVLTVDTTTVRTSSSTEVKRRGDVQTLDTLKVGQSLHVVGTRMNDGSLDARLIEIDDDAVGGEFEIEGSLGGLHGTCPTLSFTVNGFAISTSASTTFEGGACSSLKSGNKVDVQGTKQSDGSIAATRVKKE
jgi:Domain of unknown function (DUF5666)